MSNYLRVEPIVLTPDDVWRMIEDHRLNMGGESIDLVNELYNYRYFMGWLPIWAILDQSKTMRSEKEWSSWLDDESSQFDYDRYGELFENWTKDQAAFGQWPFLFFTKDGMDIADGWHRVGLAITNGLDEIFAVWGIPRKVDNGCSFAGIVG